MPPGRETRIAWLGLGSVGLLVLALYAPILRAFCFLSDDFDLMGQPSLAALLKAGVHWYDFSPKHVPFPLFPRAFFYMLHVFGLSGPQFGLFCVLLHLGNCILVFLIARRFLGAWRPALLVAAFFAVMTAHFRVASLLYVSLSHGLATFCVLAALLFLDDACLSRRKTSYLLALIVFGCGLLCHQEAACLPLLAVFWLRVRAPDLSRSQLVKVCLPFAAIALADVGFERAVYLAGHFDPRFGMRDYVAGWHVVSNLILYLLVMVGPIGYELTPRWLLMAAVVCFLMAAAGFRFESNRTRAAAAMLLSALLIFLPCRNATVLISCRYNYLASVFFCLLLGAGCQNLPSRPAAWACAVFLIGAWSYKTYSLSSRESRKRLEERANLEAITEAACAKQGDKQSLDVIWPSATPEYGIDEGRLNDYLRLSCGGSLPVRLYSDYPRGVGEFHPILVTAK